MDTTLPGDVLVAGATPRARAARAARQRGRLDREALVLRDRIARRDRALAKRADPALERARARDRARLEEVEARRAVLRPS